MNFHSYNYVLAACTLCFSQKRSQKDHSRIDERDMTIFNLSLGFSPREHCILWFSFFHNVFQFVRDFRIALALFLILNDLHRFPLFYVPNSPREMRVTVSYADKDAI